jgi:Na+/H+ antiporter NhaD/arsenite permease-like protein
MPRSLRSIPLLAAFSLAPIAARAAEIDGAALSAWWGVPFAGMLLSIALLPLFSPRLWHHHHGKVAAAWALAFLLPFALRHGVGVAAPALVHTTIAEYLPFVLLLTALYTVAGGIHVRGNFAGGPGFNTGLMALGAVLASVMGTTGASMLLIRPLIRANDDRPRNAHVVVFFIFIVANIGGSLTPLGDPPLFLGFLQGVEFSWTLRHLFVETFGITAALLVVFYLLDRRRYATDGTPLRDPTPDTPRFAVEGTVNLPLLAMILILVLMSGTWKPGVEFTLAGTSVGLPQLLRDAGLVGVTLLSLGLTPRAAHRANEFSWGPMLEVAKLFAGIFVTIVPVLAMLQAGPQGAFAPVVALVHGPDGEPLPLRYFWATGLLSSVLDNAPTYLVFFNLAGGDAQQLMTQQAAVLAAVSAGAVFMGANTYIGNAPNLMVKAVAEDRGVRMPGFFAYMAWSGAVLLPLFALCGLLAFSKE